MKIVGEAASTNEFHYAAFHGKPIQFTTEQLQKLAGSAVGQIISWGFDHELGVMGKVTYAHVVAERLMIHARLWVAGCERVDRETKKQKPVFIVPAFVEPEYRCTGFALTISPCDKSLGPIREVLT